MIKITFEFETKAEAAAFLSGEDAVSTKKKKAAPSAADLMGDGKEPEEDEEDEDEKPITMKTIQPVLEAVANAGKGEAVKKLLKKLGATGGASTLPKAKYKAFYDGLKELED